MVGHRPVSGTAGWFYGWGGERVGILGEVFDTLSGLLAEGGLEDPTFRRMVEVYREVTQDLNCRSEYERMLAGLMKHTGSATFGEAGDRLSSQRPVRFSFL